MAVNMTTGLNMPGFNQGTGVVQEVIHRTIKDEGPHPKSRTVCDVKVKYVSADNNASAKSQSESLKQINNIGCQINTGDEISYIYNVESNEGALASPASTTALHLKASSSLPECRRSGKMHLSAVKSSRRSTSRIV